MVFPRRRFLEGLGLSIVAIAEVEKVQAAGFLSGVIFHGDQEEDLVLNAVADTILPKIGDGRIGDFTAGDLNLPGRFYRDPYFGVASFLGWMVRDLQGRAFMEDTETFFDLPYVRRLALYEEGRRKALGPVKNLFNGIVALTHYGALAASPEGRGAMGYSLDPSQHFKDFNYPGVSFPTSGMTVAGNLP